MHERDVWEQIVDQTFTAFLVDEVTISEAISATTRDDFHWASDLQTGSGPTSYQNAPGAAPMHGVIEDKLFNCDAVLNQCASGGGSGLLSILNQQDSYGGVPLTTTNSLHETCSGFTVNGH
jgi:hypothetical protein